MKFIILRDFFRIFLIFFNFVDFKINLFDFTFRAGDVEECGVYDQGYVAQFYSSVNRFIDLISSVNLRSYND